MGTQRKGLVLEGGAMRGMFTCGVIDVFMENGISFDGAAGISAGATFGCNYKSRQIGRAIRYNKKYSKDWRYCSLRSLIKTGDLYGAEFCYHTMPEVLDPFDTETFKNDPMEFYLTAELDELFVSDSHCPYLFDQLAVIHVVEKALNVELYDVVKMRHLHQRIGSCNSMFR